MTYFKKEPLTVLFLILVIVSFAYHVFYSKEHYQEADSEWSAYTAIYSFPISSLTFSVSGVKGNYISPALGEKILETPLAEYFIKKYTEKYNGGTPIVYMQEFKARLLKALTWITPVSAVRLAFITVADRLPLPHFLLAAFALPTASTYAVGSGLFYGLLSTATTPWSDFVNHGIILTLFLFHLSIILLFFSGRRLGFGVVESAIVATSALFSISLYSYGYHLGSTIWNVAASAAWLWFLVSAEGERNKMLKRMSMASGILLFFNYLIVFFWLALTLSFFYGEWRSRRPTNLRGALREIFSYLKTQKVFLICLVITLIFFYPFGESNRGLPPSLAAVPQYFYYIVLDFFAWFNSGTGAGPIQFTLAILVLAAGFYALSGSARKRNNSEEWGPKVLLAILAVYAAAALFHVLPFFPSRHMLFLAPVVFLLALYGFGFLVRAIKIPQVSLLILWLALVLIGFQALTIRTLAARNPSLLVTVPQGAEAIVDYPCFNFKPAKPTNLPVICPQPATFALKEGGTYFYVSQVYSLAAALQTFRDAQTYRIGVDLQVEVLSEFSSLSDTCFISYPPPAGNRISECGFGQNNNIYTAEFRVKKFTKLTTY